MSETQPRAIRFVGVDQWFGLTLIFCFASIFLIDVPMPLSRSGTLEVSAVDFVSLGVWAWLGFALVRRRWRPSSLHVALLVAIAVFLVWFSVVELIRLTRGDEVLQAVLILRSTLLPLAAYLVFGARLDRPDRALNALVIFEAALTLYHLGEWHNMRMSSFLGNSIVFAGLLVMLLPVNVFVAAGIRTTAPPLVRLGALFNMLAALVLPVWAGSRGLSGLAFICIVGCFLLMLGNRRFTVTMIGVGVAATVIQALVWWFNPMGSAYGIYRLVPPPGEISATWVNEDRNTVDLAQRETSLVEKEKSDAGRAELVAISWEHVKKDPLIGDGIVYFELPEDGVTQQYAAHNFVLEHINAYGALGFLGYLALFVIPLWPALRWIRRRVGTRHAPLLALWTAVILGGFSLTQPTSLIMAIMVPFYVAIGALLAPLVIERNADADTDIGAEETVRSSALRVEESP